jgi:Kae1-associated kinase Bud32
LWSTREFLCRGAEAEIYKVSYLGEDAILKIRTPKAYRHRGLDESIRHSRMLRESSALKRTKELGVPAPFVRYVDTKHCLIVMQFIEGSLCRDALLEGSLDWRWVARRLGSHVSSLHNGNLVHGDLTTSNLIAEPARLVFIDFGLSEVDPGIEGKAVDIELLNRVIHSTHPEIEEAFMSLFLETYMDSSVRGRDVVDRFQRVRKMGRYIAREDRETP